MSKAILVIETDDETFAKIETGKIFVKRIYCCNKYGKPIGELGSHNQVAKLKPLPQKKVKLKGRGKDHCEYSLLEQLEYRKGFNDCLDEILGGDDEEN